MHWQIKHNEQLDSTNLEAKRMILNAQAEDNLHGIVLWADQQTGGKGRMGRQWESAASDGLWFSIILKPTLPMEQASLFSFVSAVAVAEAIEQTTFCMVQLKWPNDVLVNGKKLCGILLELVPRSRTEYYLVVGIGINVNQTKEAFPLELQEKATSLAIQLGRVVDREQLLSAVLRQFEENKTLLQEHGFGTIRDKWKAKSCVLGQAVSVQQNGIALYNGVVEDLALDGTLLLRTNEGLIPITTGDVSLRTADGGYGF